MESRGLSRRKGANVFNGFSTFVVLVGSVHSFPFLHSFLDDKRKLTLFTELSIKFFLNYVLNKLPSSEILSNSNL